MNREQRRQYQKKIKHDKLAQICPICKNRTRFFTHARNANDTILICEVCNNIIREGEKLTKKVVPGIYLPVSLEVLDKWLEEDDQALKQEKEEIDKYEMVSN